MLLSVWGGALLLYPLMVLVMHRFRACGHSFGGIPFDFKTPSVWRYYAVLAVFFCCGACCDTCYYAIHISIFKYRSQFLSSY